MNKYLELEIDYRELDFLIEKGNLSFDFIILDSLKKLKSACIKNRVKDAVFGISIGPNDQLDKIMGSDIIERALRFKKLGFDFVNLNIAKMLAIKFTIHMPTDNSIYNDSNDKFFQSCIHLSNELSQDLPQEKLPLCFHAYRKKKSSDISQDLEVSRNKTVDLIKKTAKYLAHLEKKNKLKITLSLEMLNQELPTSHYIRYCVSPHQVLETYYQAIREDKDGLVQKYIDEGIFSVTFDIGHFLLDQKFQEFLFDKKKFKLNQTLYYGFEDFSRRISLFHISGILDKNYLYDYLDNRRSDEFMNKFGKEYTHHCPFLISDASKVGEVLKQVEIFTNFDESLMPNITD